MADTLARAHHALSSCSPPSPCLRAATIQTVTPCRLWALDRTVFRRIIVTNNAIAIEENKKFLRR